MVVVTLHPLNLGFALFCRLFGPVAYWRSEGLPRCMLAPFDAITPAKFTSISPADWNDFLQEAHAAFRSGGGATPALPVAALGVRADFGPVWLQWFLMQFEFDILAQHLARRWAAERGIAKCRVSHSGVSVWSQLVGVAVPDIGGIARVPGSKFADCAWETLKGLRAVAAAVARCIKPAPPRHDLQGRSFRYVFAAITAPRGAYSHQKLDFAFLPRRGLLPPESCFYIPGRALNATQAAALEQTGAAALGAPDLAQALPWVARMQLALRIVAASLGVLAKPHGAGNALVSMVARGLPMLAVAQKLHARVFIAALDEGVEEPPAMPLMRGAGMRTVIWQHALVGFGHAKEAGFRHLQLEQAAGEADTTVWTPGCRDQLEERALLPAARRGRVAVTGPLMPGDARWLMKSKHAAREAMGLRIRDGQRLIVVFDIPTFIRGERRAYRFPINRMPADAHDAFFTDLDALLQQHEGIDLALKPKRGANPNFYMGAPLCDLLDPDGARQREGRLHLLQTDVDPYLPIAAADLCIGMPFTSPVAAAANVGIPAFWYDPTNFLHRVFPPELNEVVVRGPAGLASALDIFKAGAWPAAPACLQAGVADPQVRFADFLTDARNAQGLQGNARDSEKGVDPCLTSSRATSSRRAPST